MKNLPQHVAIIMDGNGRWATEKGKKRSEGHKAGGQALENIALHAKKIGIKVLSVYAFSTDNFKRSQEEVSFLMDLFIKYCNEKLDVVIKEGVKIVFSGRKENLSEHVLNAMDNIVERSKNNTECILNICLNYGGQEEIIDATLRIHKDLENNLISEKSLNRDNFYKYLYQDLPPIDLLIRTGKEHRLSNFMLYQAFYAELYFLDVYFPDFTIKHFDESLMYYQKRDRRFGSVSNLQNDIK